MHETIFPIPVKAGNKAFEARQHFLAKLAGEILLHINELSEQFGGKIHNFKVAKNSNLL